MPSEDMKLVTLRLLFGAQTDGATLPPFAFEIGYFGTCSFDFILLALIYFKGHVFRQTI